jgi:hypothetical protein
VRSKPYFLRICVATHNKSLERESQMRYK